MKNPRNCRGTVVTFLAEKQCNREGKMEILRQRYARGEIDATTFDQMRECLGASTKPGQEQH